MTRQSTFKSKIRARMRKTGERYAAARLALLSQREPTSAPIPIPPLPGYQFAPGVEPDLGTRDGTLATWLALHDAFGPRRLGDALRFLQEEDAGLRVNRVRYYGFAALREGLAEVLGKDRDGRARLAELLPQ